MSGGEGARDAHSGSVAPVRIFELRQAAAVTGADGVLAGVPAAVAGLFGGVAELVADPPGRR